ncbi:calmodulin [Drosophila serrata]|uniref:calmodulin n=1 Tax=Drosophila serrata TaxID=7274 RepID=UPI000A1D1E9E|nr:calmodulin [Drosophila serrata]
MDDMDYSSPPPEVRTIHTHNLRDEQVKDLEEAFALFDDDHTNVIPIKYLKDLLRAVAHSLPENEVQDYITEIDTDGSGDLYLSDFLYIMSKRYEDSTPEDEVILAFRVFDKEGTGFIPETEFRQILTELGEDMDEDEIEEMIRDADANTEMKIDYVRFVTMMMES